MYSPHKKSVDSRQLTFCLDCIFNFCLSVCLFVRALLSPWNLDTNTRKRLIWLDTTCSITALQDMYTSTYEAQSGNAIVTGLGTSSTDLSSCRRMECAIYCGVYDEDGTVCKGYYTNTSSDSGVCQCILLVTGGSGAPPSSDFQVYMRTHLGRYLCLEYVIRRGSA